MAQQLSAQDAQFLYLQTGDTLTHIMGVYIYDPSTAPGGKVRFKDIVRHIGARLDTSPVFRRKLYRLPLDFDHPYWIEDPQFDLEAHVTHVRLPEPGDWRQFCIQAARHFSRPMDMNRPLWDVYVVEGLDRIPGIAPGSYALLHRVHHAAIDGASGSVSYAALSDCDADGTPALEVDFDRDELGAVPGPAELLLRATAANILSPLNFFDTLMRHSPALVGAVQRGLAEPEAALGHVPQTRFNAPVSVHKMFDATVHPFAEISAMRRLAPGATINDVVLAICSGALRRYLDNHGELPEETLIAVAPVNARSDKSEARVPGNDISAMTVELCSHIANPVERLRAIRAFTAEAKEAKTGLSARVMTDLSKHIPGATMAQVARLMASPRFAPRQTNLLITNVPGPQFQLFMNGAKQTHQFAMGPLANNMGLFIAVLSYNGAISFNITSERRMMPDIDFFRRCVDDAVAELRDAVRASKDG
ncbi:wax ester/triacylglycerol synthase family O-acyltransferase [Sphingopyxis sp.]|uniref:wax ester/triacylglycerol synthase family O-acyltransferase n=1 Tax=Sphingopyxis sp. TaxID=1908224 RepID=UPI0025CF534E|nr:wax ester/triacylglycerol synthase family O-acyltransferase [Sphingopyxis sp.]MBR2172482.1 wax ester/triacylglycerol synthase family O-acyltransferase [Sphingopyxis sp.]